MSDPDITNQPYTTAAMQWMAPDYQPAPLKYIGQRCNFEVSFYDASSKRIAISIVKNAPAYSFTGYLVGVVGNDAPDLYHSVSSRRL